MSFVNVKVRDVEVRASEIDPASRGDWREAELAEEPSDDAEVVAKFFWDGGGPANTWGETYLVGKDGGRWVLWVQTPAMDLGFSEEEWPNVFPAAFCDGATLTRVAAIETLLQGWWQAVATQRGGVPLDAPDTVSVPRAQRGEVLAFPAERATALVRRVWPDVRTNATEWAVVQSEAMAQIRAMLEEVDGETG